MANLTETPTYEANVYELSVNDPVQGGPGGIDNLQAQQLANRTAYLKAHLDTAEADIDALQAAQGGPQYLRNGLSVLPISNASPTVLDFDELDKLYYLANAAGAGLTAIVQLPNANTVPNGWPVAFAVGLDFNGATSQIKAATGQEIIDVESGAFAQTLDLKSGDYVYLFSDGTSQWMALARRQSNIGEVASFAKNSAPTGWLVCNGAAVSRVTYGRLFAAIGTTFGVGNGSTTFNLPDLRGEFIRGWDNGRGVDTGRTFGSAQADELESHTHGPGTGTWFVNLISGGGSEAIGAGGSDYVTATVTAATGGTETRPRNIALLYCIKY